MSCRWGSAPTTPPTLPSCSPRCALHATHMPPRSPLNANGPAKARACVCCTSIFMVCLHIHCTASSLAPAWAAACAGGVQPKGAGRVFAAQRRLRHHRPGLGVLLWPRRAPVVRRAAAAHAGRGPGGTLPAQLLTLQRASFEEPLALFRSLRAGSLVPDRSACCR